MGETVRANSGLQAVYSIPIPPGMKCPGLPGYICTNATARPITEEYWEVTYEYGKGEPWPPPADLDPIIRETYIICPAPPMWLAVLAMTALGCVLWWVMGRSRRPPEIGATMAGDPPHGATMMWPHFPQHTYVSQPQRYRVEAGGIAAEAPTFREAMELWESIWKKASPIVASAGNAE